MLLDMTVFKHTLNVDLMYWDVVTLHVLLLPRDDTHKRAFCNANVYNSNTMCASSGLINHYSAVLLR